MYSWPASVHACILVLTTHKKSHAIFFFFFRVFTRIRFHYNVQVLPSSCLAPVCSQICGIMHMYLEGGKKKCVHVFCINAKAVLACQHHTFPSLCHLFRACGRRSVKANTALLLIEDASRLPRCPAGTAAADRRQRGGDGGGRHRTYNSNKFEARGEHWPIGHAPSLTSMMLRKRVSSLCYRERRQKHLRRWKKEGKDGRGLELVPVSTEGEGSQYFYPLFFFLAFPLEMRND